MKLDDEIDALINAWANVNDEHGEHTQRFDVPRKLKSQNELRGNTKTGNGLYVSERAWWHKQFATAVMAGLVTVAKGPRYVRITRVIGPGGRLMDVGNIVGGCKALVDAMVNTGLLVDDSPAHCSIYYRQRKGTIDQVSFEFWGEYQGKVP